MHRPTPTVAAVVGASIKSAIATAPSAAEVKVAHALAVVSSTLPFHDPTCPTLILAYAALGHFPSSRTLFRRAPPPPTTFLRLHHLPIPDLRGVSPPRQLHLPCHPQGLRQCVGCGEGFGGPRHDLKLGFDSDVFVNNTLILFYGAAGHLPDARKVFDEMPQRDVISWNSIVSLLSNSCCLLEGVCRFSDLISDSGVKVNRVSVVRVLPACAMLEVECAVKVIHGFVVKAGWDSEVAVCNAFVDVCGKCENVGDSKHAFDGIMAKSAVSWNADIGSFARVNEIIGDLDMFRAMLWTNEA